MNKKEDNKKIRNEMAVLLIEVLDGKISAKAAIDSWPNEKMDLDKLIDLAWHELYHYYSDEDIRLKDKEYGKWQINKLKNISDKLLGLIKED